MSEAIEYPESRQEEAKQYHERQKRKKESKDEKPVKEWFEAVGQKVVKKSRSKQGNVSSVYWGTLKQAKTLGLELK